jgi:hypothetical protein
MSDETARARLLELSDFAGPWSIWIAATLRLADHIEAGSTRAEDLAAASRADADTLRRLHRPPTADAARRAPAPSRDALRSAPGRRGRARILVVEGVLTQLPRADEAAFDSSC